MPFHAFAVDDVAHVLGRCVGEGVHVVFHAAVGRESGAEGLGAPLGATLTPYGRMEDYVDGPKA